MAAGRGGTRKNLKKIIMHPLWEAKREMLKSKFKKSKGLIDMLTSKIAKLDKHLNNLVVEEHVIRTDDLSRDLRKRAQALIDPVLRFRLLNSRFKLVNKYEQIFRECELSKETAHQFMAAEGIVHESILGEFKRAKKSEKEPEKSRVEIKQSAEEMINTVLESIGNDTKKHPQEFGKFMSYLKRFGIVPRWNPRRERFEIHL